MGNSKLFDSSKNILLQLSKLRESNCKQWFEEYYTEYPTDGKNIRKLVNHFTPERQKILSIGLR